MLHAAQALGRKLGRSSGTSCCSRLREAPALQELPSSRSRVLWSPGSRPWRAPWLSTQSMHSWPGAPSTRQSWLHWLPARLSAPPQPLPPTQCTRSATKPSTSGRSPVAWLRRPLGGLPGPPPRALTTRAPTWPSPRTLGPRRFGNVPLPPRLLLRRPRPRRHAPLGDCAANDTQRSDLSGVRMRLKMSSSPGLFYACEAL